MQGNQKLIFNNNLFYLLLTKKLANKSFRKVYRNNFFFDWWLKGFFVLKKSQITLKQKLNWKKKQVFNFLRNKDKVLKRFIIPRFRDFRFSFFQKLVLFRLSRTGRFSFIKSQQIISFLFYVRKKNYFIIGYNPFNGKTIVSTSAGCTGIKKKSSRKYFFTFRNFKDRARFVWYRTFYKAFGKQLHYLDISKKKEKKEKMKNKIFFNIVQIAYKKIQKQIYWEFFENIRECDDVFLDILSSSVDKFFSQIRKYLISKVRLNLKEKKIFNKVFNTREKKINRFVERFYKKVKKNKVCFTLDLKLHSFAQSNFLLYEIFLYKLLRFNYFKVSQFQLVPDSFNVHYGSFDTSRLKLANKRRL